MIDLYYILGLDANCTVDEINGAYSKLSKKFRLDLNHSSDYFKNRFTEFNEAYETLSDPGKRLQYDKALKKAKSNPINEEFKRRQNCREQAECQPYQTQPSFVKRYKIKGPGIGIILSFILLALITGIYFAESLGNSKTHRVVSVSPVSVVAYKSHKQHKKNHNLNNKDLRDSSKFNTINIVAKPVQPIAISKLAVTDNNNEPAPVRHTNISNERKFLYATFVKANITGVVNMRKFANYNSPVIKVIPNNSKVLVMKKGHIYNKVSYNNLVGYVPKWLLQTQRD